MRIILELIHYGQDEYPKTDIVIIQIFHLPTNNKNNNSEEEGNEIDWMTECKNL